MSYESLWGFRGLKLRPVKAEAVIKVLEGSGFSLPGRKAVMSFCNILMEGVLIIPDHQGEELGRGVLRAIIRQAGLTREEFLTKLLR